MSELYSISSLAEEFAVTPRTLRFYEEKGMLQPQRHGTKRIYNAADRTRLRLILRGKRLGFTLDESSEIIGMYDPAASTDKQMQLLIDKIHQKQALLQQQQKDLKLTLSDLRAAEQRCIDSMQRNNN